MKATKIYFLLLIALVMAGCINENEDDCPADSSIYFSYKGDGGGEIFSSKIKKVNLYVYDESNALVQKLDLNESYLNKWQGVSLNLPDGNYHLVCWGNTMLDTQFDQDSHMETALLGPPNYFINREITTSDSIYFGYKDIAIPNYEVDTVHFSGAHIKMRMFIEGMSFNLLNPNPRHAKSMSAKDTPVEPMVRLEVTNLSPTVNFRKINSPEKVSYYPLLNFNAVKDEFRASFNVLRFNDINDVNVQLKNVETDELLYNLPLMEFMKKNAITVNEKNEVTIGVRFKFNGTSITVNPWKEEEIKPGM